VEARREAAMVRRNLNQPVSNPRLPLRERIAKHCDWLFRHHGVHNIDLNTIAKWCDCSEDEVREIYPSIDDAVEGHLAREMLADTTFPALKSDAGTDPLVQLKTFLQEIEDAAFNKYYGRYRVARIVCNLTEKHPKSRHLVRRAKNREILLMETLCERAGCRDPNVLAEKLYLLVEGARWGLEVFDPEGPTKQLVAAANDLIACHIP
jgi:hypothetical protein